MKQCPNCQKDLTKVNENEYFCEPCDLSFAVQKGKFKPETEKKGKIQLIEEDLMILKATQEKVNQALFGDKGVEEIW